MATFPNWSGRHSVRRRLIQMAFLAAFALLPLFDLFRFDFPAGRLHLFRQEIWLDEWALVWLALMFGMWVVGAASLVLGRVYCAYACPQMVFTEIAHDIDALAKLSTRRLDPKWRRRAARVLALFLVALVSTVASVLMMAYFAPLPDVLARLARLDVGLWVGAIGAISTVLAFLDLAFVRESFCQSVCPYGLLQGVIEDGRSLHVRLDPALGECIDCQACVRVCPMAIDIRAGSFQIECTRCGSCIDSCDTILARLKPARAGVLRFDLGGFSLRSWDLKRTLVGASTLAFGLALALAVARREPVALHLSPVYEAAAARATGELVESRYLLRASNRSHGPVVLSVRLEGLPASAALSGLEDPSLAPGVERKFELVVSVPRADVGASVTPFAWVVDAGARRQRFAATFFARGKELS